MLRKSIDPQERKQSPQRGDKKKSVVVPLVLVSIAACLSVSVLAVAMKPDKPAAALSEESQSHKQFVGSIVVVPRSGEAPRKYQDRIRLTLESSEPEALVRETTVQKSDADAGETNSSGALPLKGTLVKDTVQSDESGDQTAADTSSAESEPLQPDSPDEGNPSEADNPDPPRALAEDSTDAAALGEEELNRKTKPRNIAKRNAKDQASSKVVREGSKKVNSDVRLRARPVNGAKAVATIPAGERIKVIGCNGWCEVLYAGRRGFVYKSFLRN